MTFKKCLDSILRDAQKENRTAAYFAAKVLKQSARRQSAVKAYIIAAGKVPNIGVEAQALQAGTLIFEEIQKSDVSINELLSYAANMIPSRFRAFQFYPLASEYPSAFLSCLLVTISKPGKQLNATEKDFAKWATDYTPSNFTGENSVQMPGGVVYYWKYAKGGEKENKTPEREPMSIAYFRGNWYPQIKNDYEKTTKRSAPGLPGVNNVDQLYEAAKFIWALDQAFINNYSNIKGWAPGQEFVNLVKADPDFQTKYAYPYDKNGLKTSKDKNVLAKGKTTFGAALRGPFLLLVEFNVFGLASRLVNAFSVNPQAIIKWWEKSFGGDISVLEKVAKQGAKKKPFMQKKASSFDPASLTAAIAAASAVVASLDGLLKNINGAKDEALKTTELPEIGRLETPWGEVKWGVTNNKAILAGVAMAVVAVVAIFYFNRGGKK